MHLGTSLAREEGEAKESFGSEWEYVCDVKSNIHGRRSRATADAFVWDAAQPGGCATGMEVWRARRDSID